MGLLPKFIDDAASPPAKAVGKSMANIWELAIGNHVSLWMQKQELRQKENLQDYVKKIEEKTQNIPEENLQEPKMHLIGPALDASKYYIDSEELRNMFANLVAASVDNRKSDETHPSFVEIIKQLSPLDAHILQLFKNRSSFPSVDIRLKSKNEGYKPFQNHITPLYPEKDYKLYAVSITNLQRLGLLNIDYNIFFTDQSAYNFVNQHIAYKNAEQEIEKVKNDYQSVDFQKGTIQTTPLCNDFMIVCL